MTDLKLMAVLIGSDRYLHMPDLDNAAFLNSVTALKTYLLGVEDGLGMKESLVLDLFGCDDNIERQDFLISRFLDDNKEVADAVLIYYVGHGGFLSDQQYILTVKNTHPKRKHYTALRARDLAETLKIRSAGKKVFIILDCCFAGAAMATFQAGDLSTIIENQTYDAFPALGTAMLAASSRRQPAIAPEGGTYTMLSEALLFVLKEGIGRGGDLLSLRDVAEESAIAIRRKYGLSGVMPEVHTPRHINSDIADIPFFPNRFPRDLRIVPKPVTRRLQYDSKTEPTPFESWIAYSPNSYPGRKPAAMKYSTEFHIEALGQEHVGANRNIELIQGVAYVRYKIKTSTGGNIKFFIIPMRYGQIHLYGRRGRGSEIGPLFDDPDENRYLHRKVVSLEAKMDEWQEIEIPFDFYELEGAGFVVVAPRINEGSRVPGPGHLVVSHVRIYGFEQ